MNLLISKDGTIWLARDSDIENCGNADYSCYSETSDNELIKLDSCNGNSVSLTKLEEVFKLMSSDFSGKYVVLDVKAWNPCSIGSLNIIKAMNILADEIIRLTKKYNLQNFVMVESETGTFLTHIKENSTGIEQYLIAFGDFERGVGVALEYGYSGISFEYKFKEEITPESIYLLRKKGLKIHLWTVNDKKEIDEAISINPDFIQSDNIDYYKTKL